MYVLANSPVKVLFILNTIPSYHPFHDVSNAHGVVGKGRLPFTSAETYTIPLVSIKIFELASSDQLPMYVVPNNVPKLGENFAINISPPPFCVISYAPGMVGRSVEYVDQMTNIFPLLSIAISSL